MNLIRPNGLVGRLRFEPRHHLEFESYGHVQLGPATAETLRPAQRDRRHKRPRRPDRRIVTA